MASLWFTLGTLVSSTNKTDCYDIIELLLKVALNTITLTVTPSNVTWKRDKNSKNVIVHFFFKVLTIYFQTITLTDILIYDTIV